MVITGAFEDREIAKMCCERHSCNKSEGYEHACMAGGYKARSQAQLDLQSSVNG